VHLLPLTLSQPFAKYHFVRRFFQEREYGAQLGRAIVDARPDVVLSGTTPLDVQAIALKAARIVGARFVYWLQDLIGTATRELLRDRVVGGALIGAHYERLEQRLLSRSDAIVAISERFRLRLPNVHVIPNWAPAEIAPRPKDNAFSRAHELADTFCFTYTGTLGLKHNPELLLELASRFVDRARVVVVAEGPGAELIAAEAPRRNLRNVLALPYQPFEAFADVLGAADVLVSVLEPAAGTFSVPSKVLSYLRAARPLLLSVPLDNDAAVMVRELGAGLVAPPADAEGFFAAAERLYSDATLRAKLAAAAGDYAREHFAIDRIGPRFEKILAS
jgi:colanic acid biosynthesis glycosyl transferase WcaI